MSILSFGSWITVAEQVSFDATRECLQVAREAGVTLFDTAESYANGRAEEVLGTAISDLGWERSSYILATKLYSGIHHWPHLRNTLNRKYLMQGIDGSLARLRTDYVDLLLCHRPDPNTPIEDVVWTLSDIVASGKALYWGTSEWPPAAVRAACEFAERHGLRKPVVEQPQYNLTARRRFESEYAPLAAELDLGMMTWSPLASGLLTGKYAQGMPPHSRAALPGYQWLGTTLVDVEANRRVLELSEVAAQIDCSPAQLAIAWTTMQPAVSSVILGASGPAQLRHNLAALDVVPRLFSDVMSRAEKIFEHFS